MPARNPPVYFDCNASTPVDYRVCEAVDHWMHEVYGNPEAMHHHHGRQALAMVERAREQVAAVVDAVSDQVIFTSGATESNNLALLGLVPYGLATGKRHVLSSVVEHSSVLETCARMRELGFDWDQVGVDAQGLVDWEELTDKVRNDTLLVSLMAVNNLTGMRQPIVETAESLKDRDIFFHVDAAQGFGRPAVDLRSPHIHMISLSGHKMYGPKGVGALIVREGVPLKPLMFGGGQQGGLRPGTLPAPLIGGLGLAAELAEREGERRAAQCARMGKNLVEALEPLRPVYLGDPNRSLSHVKCLAVPGVEASLAIGVLADQISLSRGSACASAQAGPSHVLKAMSEDPAILDGAMRFSWHHLTPEPDWHRLRGTLEMLRG